MGVRGEGRRLPALAGSRTWGSGRGRAQCGSRAPGKRWGVSDGVPGSEEAAAAHSG